MTLNYNFTGKTVLVTGGSKGIGKYLVQELAESGARVISLSRSVGTCYSIKSEAISNIEEIKCDISKWDEVISIVKSLLPVDYLVNNAAFAKLNKFGDIGEVEIDEIFNTNVKAIINISQVVAGDWKTRHIKGVIVNVSSQASKRAIADHTTYCAAKAAVDAITRNMALELGAFGIRVNSVNPTAILTEMGKLYWSDPSNGDKLTKRLPLERLGEINEVVDVIMFLLTNRCTLVTGATIPIDGGFWAC